MAPAAVLHAGREDGLAVIVTLAMPGVRPETLRLHRAERSFMVSAVGRGAVVGIDADLAAQLSTCYEHDIEFDHRIDAARVRAELDGVDAVRVVLPLRRGPRVPTAPVLNQPFG